MLLWFLPLFHPLNFISLQRYSGSLTVRFNALETWNSLFRVFSLLIIVFSYFLYASKCACKRFSFKKTSLEWYPDTPKCRGDPLQQWPLSTSCGHACATADAVTSTIHIKTPLQTGSLWNSDWDWLCRLLSKILAFIHSFIHIRLIKSLTCRKLYNKKKAHKI